MKWDLERIRELIGKSLTPFGRESIVFELEERDSEILTLDKIPHRKDDMVNAFKALRRQIRDMRDFIMQGNQE